MKNKVVQCNNKEINRVLDDYADEGFALVAVHVFREEWWHLFFHKGDTK